MTGKNIMEKSEVSRLINSFNAIKGYFDTTKKYMPQIAKLVVFIEEVIPLLNTIHAQLHQSTNLIPSATEKLDKVTSATEMAATEVMNIVDNVISRLNKMSESLDLIEQNQEIPGSCVESVKENTASIRAEIDGSQDDLFSIMNALQFQDITTQQINSISETITNVHIRLAELLKGFEEDGITIANLKKVAYDPNAEYNFEKSAESQKIADEVMHSHKPKENTPVEDDEQTSAPVIYDENGQPDVKAIMNQLNSEDNGNKSS